VAAAVVVTVIVAAAAVAAAAGRAGAGKTRPLALDVSGALLSMPRTLVVL
jgi:hypothetical protein